MSDRPHKQDYASGSGTEAEQRLDKASRQKLYQNQGIRALCGCRQLNKPVLPEPQLNDLVLPEEIRTFLFKMKRAAAREIFEL